MPKRIKIKDEPSVPIYGGNRMPLSTHLAERVRDMMCDPAKWNEFPSQVREWLELQQQFSVLPTPNKLLVETFPRGAKHYLVAYCFEGRLALYPWHAAHQTHGAPGVGADWLRLL